MLKARFLFLPCPQLSRATRGYHGRWIHCTHTLFHQDQFEDQNNADSHYGGRQVQAQGIVTPGLCEITRTNRRNDLCDPVGQGHFAHKFCGVAWVELTCHRQHKADAGNKCSTIEDRTQENNG